MIDYGMFAPDVPIQTPKNQGATEFTQYVIQMIE